jgi:iron(III) transport system permease protein
MDVTRGLFIFTLIALAYLVLPPLFFILYSSLSPDLGQTGLTLEHFTTVLASLSDIQRLLWNSLLFAVGSSAVALTMGTTLAWLAERTDARFRTAAYISAYLSFGVPGIIKVVGWILLLGPKAGFLNVAAAALTGAILLNLFSLPGMILIEGLLWTPVVFLLMATPFRSMDPSLEESAAISGSTSWQVFRRITFPLALPSALAVLMLTFVRSLEAFEIPALVGIPAGVEVFTTKIYFQIRQGFLPRYGQASAYSVILILLVGLSLLPYYRVTRNTYKYTTITGRGFRPRRIPLGSWRWLGGALLLFLPAIQVLPLAAMTWASFLPYSRQPSLAALELVSLDNYTKTLSDITILRSISNSIIVSVAAATGAVALTYLTAWLVVRSNLKSRWALDQIAMIPLVFPGIVMGVAILKTYLALPVPIYGTLWILVFAFTTRYLPYALRFCYSGLLGIHRELEEGAAASGATWAQTARSIVIPLTLPALFAGWIYIFLITIRDLGIALLLYSPGSQVISVTIWELWENGHTGELAAFSLVVSAGTVFLAMLFHRFAERHSLQV